MKLRSWFLLPTWLAMALLFAAPDRQLECESDDALHSAPRKNRGLNCHFIGLMMVDESTHLGVLTFRVFADDHHIDVAALFAGQRRPDALIENRGAYVRVLIEGAANRQEQAVQRNVVGNIGMSDSAEQDRIAGPKQIQRILGHHPTIGEVVCRSPVEILKLTGEIVLLPGPAQDSLGLRNHFLACAVTGDDCNFKLSQETKLTRKWKLRLEDTSRAKPNHFQVVILKLRTAHMPRTLLSIGARYLGRRRSRKRSPELSLVAQQLTARLVATRGGGAALLLWTRRDDLPPRPLVNVAAKHPDVLTDVGLTSFKSAVSIRTEITEVSL